MQYQATPPEHCVYLSQSAQSRHDARHYVALTHVALDRASSLILSNSWPLLLTWIKAIVDHSYSAGQFHAGHRATLATRRRFSLACCEGASCLVAVRRVFVASTLQFSIIHAAPVRGLRVTGLAVVVSVVVASRSSLFLSLSFACWLSLYTLSSQIANQDNTDTTKTIANTSIRRRVATTRRRHKDSGHHSHGHTQGRHGHVTTAMSRDATTSRARRPRHGTTTATPWPRRPRRART